MNKIGLLFSNKDYQDRFVFELCSKVDYFKKEIISDDMVTVELRTHKLYLLVVGRGQNNAVIGVAKLYHNHNCKTIVSIDTCTWVHSQDSVKIGEIKEFRRNIINYDYKRRPELFHYDECGVSDYALLFDCMSEDKIKGDLLMTTNNDISSSEIMDNLKLKWRKYDNIFYDDSGYGVLAYCTCNCLKYAIIRVVKGLVDNLSVECMDKVVDYCIENEII